MKRGFVLGVVLAFALVGARAQDKAPEMAKNAKAPAMVTLKGYIVDQSCGKGMAKKDNPMQRASSHTRDCALEEGCSASGYGLFSDGKWYVFDKESSGKVKSTLENDKREKALAFEVTGTVEGNTVTLASLKPTKLEAPAMMKSGDKKEKP